MPHNLRHPLPPRPPASFTFQPATSIKNNNVVNTDYYNNMTSVASSIIKPSSFPPHRAAKLRRLIPRIDTNVRPLAARQLAKDLMKGAVGVQNSPQWMAPFMGLMKDEEVNETLEIWFEGCRFSYGFEPEDGRKECFNMTGLRELTTVGREHMRDLAVIFNMSCEEINSSQEDEIWGRLKRYSKGTPFEKHFVVSTLTEDIPKLENLTFLTLDIVNCRQRGERTKADIAAAPATEYRPDFWVWQGFRQHLPTCLKALKQLEVFELNCGYEVELIHFINGHLGVKGVRYQEDFIHQGLPQVFQYYTWTPKVGKKTLEWIDDDTALDTPFVGLNPTAESFYPGAKLFKTKSPIQNVQKFLEAEEEEDKEGDNRKLSCVRMEREDEEQGFDRDKEDEEDDEEEYDWSSRGQIIQIMDSTLCDRDLKTFTKSRFRDVISGHLGFDMFAPVTRWRAAMFLLTDERYEKAVYEASLPALSVWED